MTITIIILFLKWVSGLTGAVCLVCFDQWERENWLQARLDTTGLSLQSDREARAEWVLRWGQCLIWWSNINIISRIISCYCSVSHHQHYSCSLYFISFSILINLPSCPWQVGRFERGGERMKEAWEVMIMKCCHHQQYHLRLCLSSRSVSDGQRLTQ